MKPRVAPAVGDRAERARSLVARHHITPERACRSKVRYANQNDARHAAKGISRERNRAVATYKCPFPACGGYHLTVRSHGEDA